MSINGQLFSIFSNIWFYIGEGNTASDTENINQIKQIYGINKAINLDNKVNFWGDTMSKFNQYDPSIVVQLQINNSVQLAKIFLNITNIIKQLITNPSTLDSRGHYKDHMILFYTINPYNSECLIGLYIYFLCKICGLNIKTATELLKTKIQLNTTKNSNAIVHMSNDMKKFLILHCINNTST